MDQYLFTNHHLKHHYVFSHRYTLHLSLFPCPFYSLRQINTSKKHPRPPQMQHPRWGAEHQSSAPRTQLARDPDTPSITTAIRESGRYTTESIRLARYFFSPKISHTQKYPHKTSHPPVSSLAQLSRCDRGRTQPCRRGSSWPGSRGAWRGRRGRCRPPPWPARAPRPCRLS